MTTHARIEQLRSEARKLLNKALELNYRCKFTEAQKLIDDAKDKAAQADTLASRAGIVNGKGGDDTTNARL
jgi:hypothetical protein